MTTPLVRPLSREVLVGGTAYRVTITAAGIELREKGRRRAAINLTWDDLVVRATEQEDAGRVTGLAGAGSAAPVPSKAVLAEVARDIRAAAGTLALADASLTQIGGLPAVLMATDSGAAQREQQNHWFVEPLLTVADVAGILRVSTRAVRRLPLAGIMIAGELRFRQSELRELLRRGQGEMAPPTSRFK